MGTTQVSPTTNTIETPPAPAAEATIETSPAPAAEATTKTSPASITPTCLGLQLIALGDSVREAFAIIEYVLVAVVLAISIAVSLRNKCC